MKPIIFIAVLLFSSTGFAEVISGVVKVVGSSFGRKTMLYSENSDKYQLCSGDLAKRVGRLSGMTLEVSGDWKTSNGKKSCLNTDSFRVLKTSSGRNAIVGVLKRNESGFTVSESGGKEHLFTDVPKGLKKLVGSNVIIDARPVEGPKSSGYKVVTYSLVP